MSPSHAGLVWFRIRDQDESWHLPALAELLLTLHLLALGSFPADGGIYSRDVMLTPSLSGVLKGNDTATGTTHRFPTSCRQNQRWLVLDSETPRCHVSSRWNTESCDITFSLFTFTGCLRRQCFLSLWWTHFQLLLQTNTRLHAAMRASQTNDVRSGWLCVIWQSLFTSSRQLHDQRGGHARIKQRALDFWSHQMEWQIWLTTFKVWYFRGFRKAVSH